MTFMGLLGLKLSFNKKVEVTKKPIDTITKVQEGLKNGFKYNAILINVKIEYKSKNG